MLEVWEIISIVVTAATKFLFSAPLSLGLGYSVVETILIITLGGWFGVVLFYYFGGWVTDQIIRLVKKLVKNKKEKEKKTFTRRNRMIAKIKGTYGLIGISIITPCMVSIPIGCIIASRYFRNDRKTVPFLMLSVFLWACILTGMFSFIAD